MRVSIFINQTASSSFLMLINGAVLKRRWQGELEFDEGAPDEEVLNEIFRIFNIEFPPSYSGPSLSIADVITLDESRSYEVASFGFKRLDFTVAGEAYKVRLPRPTIPQITEWRTARRDAKLPHSIDDFYCTHNFCRGCKGEGRDTFGAAPCSACGGTGEYQQTP